MKNEDTKLVEAAAAEQCTVSTCRHEKGVDTILKFFKFYDSCPCCWNKKVVVKKPNFIGKLTPTT